MSSLGPAYLYIGNSQAVIEQAQNTIKAVLCKKQSCNKCIDCKNIDQRQHAYVRWLVPETIYTVSMLESIFKTIMFSLDVHEHFFFVLERCELLQGPAAHRLLKSLEEPTPGYHFILLSPIKESILPTIVSRCVVQTYASTHENYLYTLMVFFTSITISNAAAFVKECERSKISERDVPLLLDYVMSYWLKQFKDVTGKNSQKQIKYAQSILEIIQQLRATLPMPGSAKVFLKDLYLRLLAIS